MKLEGADWVFCNLACFGARDRAPLFSFSLCWPRLSSWPREWSLGSSCCFETQLKAAGHTQSCCFCLQQFLACCFLASSATHELTELRLRASSDYQDSILWQTTGLAWEWWLHLSAGQRRNSLTATSRLQAGTLTLCKPCQPLAARVYSFERQLECLLHLTASLLAHSCLPSAPTISAILASSE